MVQAVTDAVEPDGGAGRSIWEGPHFPNEVPGRGREEKRQERRETQGKEGGREEDRERLSSLHEVEGASPAALANESFPLQTPLCGRRSTCGSGWSGR